MVQRSKREYQTTIIDRIIKRAAWMKQISALE